MKKDGFLASFGILAFAIVFVKFVGALYKIPLGNILKGEGMGIYQMIFPLYSLLLTLSSSAIPSALAKSLSEKWAAGKFEEADKIFVSARAFLMVGGGIFSLLLMLFARPFALWQGEVRATMAYVALAPSIYIVSMTALYRGYYQGKFNMRVTALSQIIEQLVKCVLGIATAYILRRNVIYAVVGASLAVTVSELSSLIYVKFKARRLVISGKFSWGCLKEILKLTLPMTLSFCVLPLSSILESAIIINSVGGALPKITQYGLYSGGANTLVNFPISIISVLGVVLIPTISAGGKHGRDKTSLALKICLLIALPCAIAFFLLPKEITNILFFKFPEEEKELLVKILRFESVNVLLLSVSNLLSSALYGLGKATIPFTANLVGMSVKFILIMPLINAMGIVGGVISSQSMFFVAIILQLIYIIREEKLRFSKISAINIFAYTILSFAVIFACSKIGNDLVKISVAMLAEALLLVIFALKSKVFEEVERKALFNKFKE